MQSRVKAFCLSVYNETLYNIAYVDADVQSMAGIVFVVDGSLLAVAPIMCVGRGDGGGGWSGLCACIVM